jgi:polyhydroxybutyrate depolymerase
LFFPGDRRRLSSLTVAKEAAMEMRRFTQRNLLVLVALAMACTGRASSTKTTEDAALVATGGDQVTGGVSAAGGVTRTGGTVSTGGVVRTGGVVASGGAAITDGAVPGSSAGCGKTGAATGVLTAQTIAVGGRNRTYVLSVPKAYAPATAWPLIFAWHGMGGSGSIARQYFGVDSATQGGAILVYPDGLPMGDAGSAGWDLTSAGMDMALFDALLAFVADGYCVDRNRVFATGHSYGGMMTNALGCYRGDVLRAIAPVAGMPPGAYGGSPKCVGNVAAIVIHGVNDPTVDYTRGGIGARDYWIGRNGCSTTLTQAGLAADCVDYTGCQPDLPVQFCIHNQGHDWPNGRCDAGSCLTAASVIWSFFKSFP